MPSAKKGITEQQKLLMLGGIVTVLLGFVGYQLLWRPMSAKMGVAKPKAAKMAADLEALRRELERLPALEQSVAEQRTQVSALEGRLAQGVAIDTVLADLSVLAQEAQVRLESLEPLSPPKPSTKKRAETVPAVAPGQGVYEEVPIQIRAKGGYHQLGAFIAALERHARFMRLTYLEMTGNADEPWRQSAHITVSTFRLVEPAGAVR